MVIGVIGWDLQIFEAQSLKEKRAVVKGLKDRLRNKLNVSVAETGHQDLWQRATLAAALTGGSLRRLDADIDRVERWLDDRYPSGVRVERRLASFEDLG